MNRAKWSVLLAAVALFGVWVAVHWTRVTADADAAIRFTLGILFAVLVILRRKPSEEPSAGQSRWVPILFAAGLLASLGGLIFSVHVVEWIGLLLLLFSCMAWALPRRFGKDLALGGIMLFWVHPLPGQIMGWMQGLTQRLSVMGSEIVLHGLNVRVWGDGIVLRTGYQNFLVPEACSGMRTSVTVFLCALGISLLLKLRWWELLGSVVLGLAQVLILNIARISYMVLWAPRMPPEWAENFLHDSLGVFLLGAIVLIQAETVGWHWWTRRRAFIREGIRRKEIERPDKASIVPHKLRVLMMVLMVLAGLGLLGFGIFAVVYKSRAYHRKEMIREVAEGLMETDPASAIRAFVQIRRNFPDDRDLLLKHANTLFLLKRFQDGLDLMGSLEKRGVALNRAEIISKSWALMRTDRLSDARALVQTLPPQDDRIPGVAMLKAEFAAMDALPAEVARYVRIASASQALLPRIRALFPYLARHEQWQAIADADRDRPYEQIYHTLIALRANQQMNNISGLMRVMEHALKRWPDDPRLLGTLFEIASRRRTGDWETHFERNYRANLPRMNTDFLAVAATYAWRLFRPDLAWLAYLRLQALSPDDPELIMAPARYGSLWARFRRHRLGVRAQDDNQTLSLLPVLNWMASVRPVRDLYRRIPFLTEASIASTNRREAMSVYERGLAELERRESEGDGLNERLMQLYPMVLAMLERYEEAHRRLDLIRERYPDREANVLLQHTLFYNRQSRWESAYETLLTLRRLQSEPDLTTELLRIGALVNLNLGVCAFDVLRQARAAFPGSMRLDLAESAIWDVFGFKDQALHVLEQSSHSLGSLPVAVDLLYATGRITEASRLRSALGAGIPEPRSRTPSPMWLPPALLALTPRWPAPSDAAEMDARAERLEQSLENASSPFVRDLRRLTLAWMRERREGVAVAADETALAERVNRWEAIGRSPLESVGALYELAMLAARQRDVPLARAALRRLLEIAPANAPAWRALTALSADHPETVAMAADRCPEDPELLLADLVLRTRDDEQTDWDAVEQRLKAVAEGKAFSPETLIRLGDLMLVRNRPRLAVPLARLAVARAPGLLAAHVLDLRTALMTGDADRALTAAIHGIELASDPVPFYRVMVEVKVARRQVDHDLLNALEYLKTHEGDDPRWAETLGSLYFERGDMRRSMMIFGSVLETDLEEVRVSTLVLAAESARLDAKPDHAVRILEAAYAVNPDQLGVLNNLVYLLAQNPRTLPRARSLLPALLEMGGESFAVMDTAAMVALRSGDMEQAQVWMDKALSRLEEGAYGADEVRLNAAELKMRSGDARTAREDLLRLRQDAGRSDFVDQRARMLLRELEDLE